MDLINSRKLHITSNLLQNLTSKSLDQVRTKGILICIPQNLTSINLFPKTSKQLMSRNQANQTKKLMNSNKLCLKLFATKPKIC